MSDSVDAQIAAWKSQLPADVQEAVERTLGKDSIRLLATRMGGTGYHAVLKLVPVTGCPEFLPSL